MPDPFRSSSDVGPFTGASRDRRYVWHLFLAYDEERPNRLWSTPKGLLQGTITLPSITVNGERYGEQVLTFVRASYFDLFSPVNC